MLFVNHIQVIKTRLRNNTMTINKLFNTLFDISACKCEMTLQFTCEIDIDKCIWPNPVIVRCDYPKGRKIITLEFFTHKDTKDLLEWSAKKESQKRTSRLQKKTRHLHVLSTQIESMPGPYSYSTDSETEKTNEE